MARIVEGYFTLLKVLIAVFLAVMVVLVFSNVVLRYAFNSGITVSEGMTSLPTVPLVSTLPLASGFQPMT